MCVIIYTLYSKSSNVFHKVNYTLKNYYFIFFVTSLQMIYKKFLKMFIARVRK